MLSYFPRIYPDEVLYSYFARYHDHSKNGSSKQTMYELFGKVSTVAVVDLPSSLKEFYNNILHFNPPTLNEFINKHTLFNYYTFFQATTIKITVLDYLKTGSKPGATHLLLGIAASVIKDWKYLRFCPSCIKEDRKKLGEAYWHISHQLPKVYYCTIHQEFLHSSNIKLRNPHKHEFISAETAGLSPVHCVNEFSPKTKQHLLTLSKESAILLNKIIEIEELLAIYKYLLQANGYANHFGKVNQRYFTQRFKSYYGAEFLKQVDCDFDEFSDTSWVRTIVRKHRKAFHPIQHLLLLNFFNVSIEDLEGFKGKQYQPFGPSPFYCLNPAANHFKKRVIETVNITTCTNTRKPVGTFSCSCGFIYSRRGPDLNADDTFKIGRVKAYGNTWLSKLKQLALNNYSYYQIAQILKCDYATVKKYVEINDYDKPLSIKVAFLTRSEKEFEWQELIRKYPKYTVTQLRKAAPALYAWHYRNNKEWLKEHSPKVASRTNANKRVDWNKRDLEVLNQVKRVIRELYAIEKPVFVNKSRVGKLIGKQSLLEKLLFKLPRTKSYLDQNLETREEYQIRRIKWACKELYEKNEGIIPLWKVRRLAGLRTELDEKLSNEILGEIDLYQKKSKINFK